MFRKVTLSLGILTVVALLAWWGLGDRAKWGEVSPTQVPLSESGEVTPVGSPEAESDSSEGPIKGAQAAWNDVKDMDQVGAVLARLALLERPTAVAAVLDFLRSGVDVPLGGTFAIGPDGWLTEWPSLRVAMLDFLSKIDPAAAKFFARELLRDPKVTNPAEIALALREMSRGLDATDWEPIVGQRLVEVLASVRQANSPERASLESFDIVVAGRALGFLPVLQSVLEEGSKGGRFAAFLTLDRLALAEPAATLSRLNQDPSLLAEFPELRGGLYARGDVRATVQLGALQRYFERADISSAERLAFAQQFPLYSVSVSPNLLTTTPTKSVAEQISQDRATLAQLQHWLTQPELADWEPFFALVVERLELFLTDVPTT